jgi:2-hydroxy-6-oxonona-2,4-dienedioate hydrolase
MLASGYHRGWVLANGVRTHYWWAGTEGPAVVLLHGGGPGSSGEAGWRFLLPALANAGFRAYAPDQLSFGWTDARPHAWPVLGHQSLVDHVHDFVEALCLDEICIMGNSQGAYVAAKYTVDHPERVRRLFLIASGTIASAMNVEWPGRETNAGLLAIRDYDYTPEGIRRFLDTVVNDKASITDELCRTRAELSNRPGIREATQVFLDYQARMRKEPKLAARFSLVDSLPKLKVPAKFIWGKQDAFAPVEMGHELVELLPNFEFEFIDGNHQMQTDEPALVNRLVIDWFQKE